MTQTTIDVEGLREIFNQGQPVTVLDEQTFVEAILTRIPPTPPNHHRIVQLNEAGLWPDGDPTELEAGANRCAVA